MLPGICSSSAKTAFSVVAGQHYQRVVHLCAISHMVFSVVRQFHSFGACLKVVEDPILHSPSLCRYLFIPLALSIWVRLSTRCCYLFPFALHLNQPHLYIYIMPNAVCISVRLGLSMIGGWSGGAIAPELVHSEAPGLVLSGPTKSNVSDTSWSYRELFTVIGLHAVGLCSRPTVGQPAIRSPLAP